MKQLKNKYDVEEFPQTAEQDTTLAVLQFHFKMHIDRVWQADKHFWQDNRD